MLVKPVLDGLPLHAIKKWYKVTSKKLQRNYRYDVETENYFTRRIEELEQASEEYLKETGICNTELEEELDEYIDLLYDQRRSNTKKSVEALKHNYVKNSY